MGEWEHACNPCIWDVEAEISQIQGHLQLFREWKLVGATWNSVLKEQRKKSVLRILCSNLS